MAHLLQSSFASTGLEALVSESEHSLTQIKTRVSDKAAVQIDTYLESCVGLLHEISMTCDRHKALLVAQHLIGYLGGKHDLHGDMNDLIYSILNHMKNEYEPYFQRVLADIVISLLFSALRKAGKVKPMDAVIGKLLKSLAKADESACETACCIRILEAQTASDCYNLFSIEGTAVIHKSVSQDVSGQVQNPNISTYISLVSRFIRCLLNHFVIHPEQAAVQPPPGFTKSLQSITNQFKHLFASRQPAFSLTFCNTFHFLSITNELMQVDIVIDVVEAMDEFNCVAFDALETLLDAAIDKNSVSQKDDDEQEQHEKIYQAIVSRWGAQVLKYLSLFLVPVIKAVHRSQAIFQGDPHRGMQILAKLIQLLPLC